MSFSITKTVTLLYEKLIGWIEEFILLLPNLIIALILTLTAFLIGSYVQKLLKRFLPRVINNHALINFLALLAKLTALFLGLLTGIKILKLDDVVFSLLAGVGIAGLALGFAFQDIAANFIAGMALVFRKDRPFKMGDVIETNGLIGTVEEISLRDTMIKTFDGHSIFIPNKNIFEKEVTNYTLLGKRRISLGLGISYAEDLEHVKDVTKKAVNQVSRRIRQRDVEIYFEEFGDSSINFRVMFWINFITQRDYLEARDNAIINIKKAYDEAGITIPFPIRTLDFNIKGGEPLGTQLGSFKG